MSSTDGGLEKPLDHDTNIIWKRLQAAAEEMFESVCRVAFGFPIREADDASTVLTTPSGEAVGVSRQSSPLLTGCVPRAVQVLFEDHFDKAELEEGDVFVTNDPWLGGGHLLDVVVVSPVFFDGELVGFAGTGGHVNDIGGLSGAFTADATQVYEEGLIIPPTKLFEGGEKNQAVEDMIRANVRLPDQVVGDIEAMWSVNNTGASALCDIIGTYGLESYQQATDNILARSEQALRAEISAIDDGTYESEYEFSIAEVEANDGHLRIEVAVTVDGGDIHVDFSGTSDQVPAGVNSPFSNVRSVTEYVIRCMTIPEIRGSSGLSEPIAITAPTGTIVNPDRPAATEARHLTYYPAEYCLVKALGQALPDQLVTDFTAGFQVFSASGRTESGEEFIGVGMGCQTAPARATSDPPKNLMHFPGNAKIVSVEMIEQYVPILWESTNLVPDTEGAGTYRSGFAPEWVIRNHMDDSDMEIVVASAADAYQPEGLRGGHDGRSATAERLDGEGLAPTNGRTSLAPGERIRLVRSTSGGFGDPVDREEEKIAKDVRAGLLTESRARDVYNYDI